MVEIYLIEIKTKSRFFQAHFGIKNRINVASVEYKWKTDARLTIFDTETSLKLILIQC